MMDLIVSTPLSFSLTPPLDADGNPIASPAFDAAKAIGSEWVQVGQSTDEKLYIVTCRSSLEDVESLILAYTLPITIRHAQSPAKTLVVDADGNQQFETVVYLHGVAADLLAFMPDVVVTDEAGNELSRTPATEVFVGKYSGHEDWVI